VSVIIVRYILNVFFASFPERVSSLSNILKELHCVDSTVFRFVWFPVFLATFAIRIVCLVNNFTSASHNICSTKLTFFLPT
jgi:hypothetical protein